MTSWISLKHNSYYPTKNRLYPTKNRFDRQQPQNFSSPHKEYNYFDWEYISDFTKAMTSSPRKTSASIWKLECSFCSPCATKVWLSHCKNWTSLRLRFFCWKIDKQAAYQEFPLHWNGQSEYNNTSAVILFPLPPQISPTFLNLICIVLLFRSPHVALRKEGQKFP